MGCSERQKEIRRRRHRRQKMAKLSSRTQKASVSEKAHIAGKIRMLTPGAEEIIKRLELEKRR